MMVSVIVCMAVVASTAERKMFMKYVVLGKKSVNFVSSDNKEIKGANLFVGCDAEGVEGMMCDKFFVAAEKLPKQEIVVGTDIEIYFNRYGKVDAIKVD